MAETRQKPRLLVLTDIGGDPDDQQSLVRLMVHANEFDIEGLIASASGTPGELKERITRPDLIRQIVEAYGAVRANLSKHAPGFPPADDLLGRIYAGNAQRGREAVGKGHDTEGSRWIIQAADRPDSRPLNVVIWGGQTDLAQALWRVREDRGEAGLRAFIDRLRVYDIADQDGIAEWIWSEFPGLFYILNMAPKGKDRREAAFRGMYLGGDLSLVSREWMETHIRQDHGPLGALYPPRTWTAPNPHSAIKEGDTPSWFFFLNNGLNSPEHPQWGGWGGRFTNVFGKVYRDAQDLVEGERSARATVWRWRPAFQAEFQARLDWSAGDPDQAVNHPPKVVLNGDSSRGVVFLKVTAGQQVQLSAVGSRDPDGGPWEVRWFVYPEAGSFEGTIKFSAQVGVETSFQAPAVGEARTIHIIMEVRDEGEPKLFAYRRAVVTVEP